jgi:hypothetical protein
MRTSGLFCLRLFGLLSLSLLAAVIAHAHGVAGEDAAFVAANRGTQIIPFMYLGAKHMVTGYDHLLFILGVIFFLYRLREVALYVTMFSLGHSITLLLGVLGGFHVNAYLIDAIIGLSVVYKALDNLGGFRTLFGVEFNQKRAVLIFGLFHGFGLATKIQQLNPSPDGLLPNMISFNVGVELGQMVALSIMLGVMILWRNSAGFVRHAVLANAAILTAGLVLTGYQLTGFMIQRGT